MTPIVTITGTVEDIDGCRLQVGWDRYGCVRVGQFTLTAPAREQMDRLLYAADAEAARVRGEIAEPDEPSGACRDCGATGDLLEHPEGWYCRDIRACHSRRDGMVPA